MMGSRRTNEKDQHQPPTSANSPIQAKANHNALNVHSTRSSIFQEGNVSAGHFESIPDCSLLIAPGWENVYSMNQGHNAISAGEMPETSGNPMPYFMNPSSFQNPQINLNSSTANTDLQEVPLLPDWNTTWSPQFINKGGHNAISAGGMNDVAGIGNFENTWSSKNPTTARNVSADLQMNNRQTEESKFVPFDPSFFHSPSHFFPRDTAPVHTRNNANNFNTSQCGAQGTVERSFLSLGIGGNEEAIPIPSSNSGNREISNKLKEAASELKLARARKAMGQTLDANFTDFQRNTTAFSNQLDQIASTGNVAGVHCTQNSGPGSRLYHTLEMRQNDMQHGISRHDDTNSTFQSNRNVVYGDSNHHRAFVGDQPVHSTQFLDPQHYGLNRGMSRTPSGQLQNIRIKTANNLPSQSSMNSPLKLGSSSTRQNYAINQGKHHMLQNHMPTQIPQGSLFSQRTQVPQVSWVSSGQGFTDLPFPKRLGVEFNGRDTPQAAERQVAPRGITGQTCPIPNRGSANHPLNSEEPFFTHGQSQNTLVPTTSVDGLSKRPDLYVKPFHKRTAVAPPSGPHWVQRQKMTPVTNPTMPIRIPTKPAAPGTTQSQTQRVHPAAAPVNPSRPNFRPSAPSKPAPTVSHVPWKDPERTPQLTKYKCLLCKRDLALTSEGAVYQPTVPPAVAVLPCGHTFHDQCLQKITPQDQAKDPPCIPCAIGEN